MCGIAFYWAREAILSAGEYRIMLEGALKRGQDGVGYAIYNKFTRYTESWEHHQFIKNQIVEGIRGSMYKDNSFMLFCRATPETEKLTNNKMLQPIISNGNILVHNGGVTESIRKEFKNYEYSTEIDSEIILAAYEDSGCNMKVAMERLSGSFAFILIDSNKNKMFAVTSFNPLAHMYIKGYGYFIHSDNEVLQEVLESLTGSTRDSMNVWESWYHHYLPPYSITETDFDSGAQVQTKYKPRFIHPIWDSMQHSDKRKTYVVASGGIDSGLTAWILKLVGRDVTMIHFDYGQKAEEAETWAVKNLANKIGCRLISIDLKPLYTELKDISMLTSKEIGITSGGDNIKSTVAWVAGRNALFSAIVLSLAETSIFRDNYEMVSIAAGWAQLSEETGGYPDNSFYFLQALNALKDVGYISGHRIEFLSVLQRVTKTECWSLGEKIGFPFECTVSCDNPVMKNGRPQLCTECGSTKLSMIAADRACVADNRTFATERPNMSQPSPLAHPKEIINRLMLTEAEKDKLKELI